MKNKCFNKAKIQCRTIAMILVFAILMVSVEGCGKRTEQVQNRNAVKTIQINATQDRIQEKPLEKSALLLNDSFEKLELAYDSGNAFSESLKTFQLALFEYLSVYEETEDAEDDYVKKMEKTVHTAELLGYAEGNERDLQMAALQKLMGETQPVHTYGDELIEAQQPQTETEQIESLEAYTSEISDAPEEEEAGAKKENLETEEETVLSEAMKQKAEELKTPLAIYNYLKNNLQYENYYGSRKGAAATYDAMGGNDVDQASVLIAMLRYLGYEAVYAEGNAVLSAEQAVELTGAEDVTAAANVLSLAGTKAVILVEGDKAAGVKIHHIWVRAYVPYGDYRGAGKNAGEKRWVDLDVSFKKQEDTEKNIYKDGTGLGIDSDQIVKEYRGGTTGTLDALLESDEFAGQAEGMYAVRKKIKEESYSYLPLSLPYPAEDVQTFEKVEKNDRDRITVTVGDASLGTYTASELYGKRMVLEYRPATEADQKRIEQEGGIFEVTAYRVNMIPVLKVDGKTVAEGEAVPLGTSADMTLKVHSAGTTYSSHDRVTAGSIYQISLDTQSITPEELEQARAEAEAVKDTVSEENVYTDASMGVLLKYAGTMYFAQTDVINRMLAEADGVASVRNLSVGITEYEVSSVSALGRVVGIQEGSLCIDVDMDVHSRTSLSSQEDPCISVSLAYGMAASRYEDVIWKEFTGQDSISTMSIFEQAEKEETALVTLNKKNYNDTVSRVSADEDTLAAVKSAVDQGRTVLIPEREVTVNEWEGTGYLILNPETGSGNYMISGGLSGGSTSTAVTIAGVCAVIAQIAMVALLAVMMGNLLSALFGAALIVQVIYVVFLVMTLYSFLSMTARAGNLMEAVSRYAAGDTSYEEYILSEFKETTIDLAELVMYMAMFEFAMGKVLGGSGGSGGIGSEGETGSESGSGSGSESGSGSGTGESGGGTGSSGVGEGGTSTLNDWVNRIPELLKQAPIEIPSSATVKVQAKNGYEQISFKWTENGKITK